VLIRADLSDADLDGADFMHAALNGTDLLGANLAGALFRHAVLGEAGISTVPEALRKRGTWSSARSMCARS